jgi:hypothetical protein
LIENLTFHFIVAIATPASPAAARDDADANDAATFGNAIENSQTSHDNGE